MYENKSGASRDDLLPSYEDAIVLPTRSSEPLASESLPEIDKVFEKVKKDGNHVKTTIMSHALTHAPEILEQHMKSQANAVPSPIVRIRGTHLQPTGVHNEKGQPFTRTVVDFNITISLRERLDAQVGTSRIVPNGWRAYRGTRTETDGLNSDVKACHPVRSLEEWCHDFCAYRLGPKEFKFTSNITGLDQTVSYNAIMTVIRDVKYAGLQVTVEADDQTTTLESGHLMARLQLPWHFWPICIILQLWIICLPISWLLTKRWDVLTIEWPAKAMNEGPGCVENWKLATARGALGHMTGGLASPVSDAEGRPLKALGDFDEVRLWGGNE